MSDRPHRIGQPRRPCQKRMEEEVRALQRYLGRELLMACWMWITFKSIQRSLSDIWLADKVCRIDRASNCPGACARATCIGDLWRSSFLLLQHHEESRAHTALASLTRGK